MIEHYRVKSRYTFGNVSELFLQNASIPANKVYHLMCLFLQREGIKNIQVLTVRNVNNDIHVGFDVTSPIIDRTALINYLIENYTDGKIWGIWENSKIMSIIYGEPYIMDYIDVPCMTTDMPCMTTDVPCMTTDVPCMTTDVPCMTTDVPCMTTDVPCMTRYLIPVGVGSFTTLNRDTMSATYDWIQRRIGLKDVVVIGRDVLKSSYWFAHNGHNVVALSESAENYEDAVMSISLNPHSTNILFLKYNAPETYIPTSECCLVFNGRDFNKNAIKWLDTHILHVNRVIVVTCKEKRIPTMDGWYTKEIEFIDQQPGTDIIQQMTVFEKVI